MANARPPHAPAAEHLVELLLVGRVIGNGRGRIFELMAGQDADHALVAADDPLIAEEPCAGHARGAGRFAAETAGGNLGLRVENFLIADLPHDAVHVVERSQALPQVHRPIDFDGAGNRRGLAAELIEFRVVVLRNAAVGLAAVPAQARASRTARTAYRLPKH